jgi:hypothetical protein
MASLRKALGADRAARLGAEVRPRLPAFREAALRLHVNLAAIVAGWKQTAAGAPA